MAVSCLCLVTRTLLRFILDNPGFDGHTVTDALTGESIDDDGLCPICTLQKYYANTIANLKVVSIFIKGKYQYEFFDTIEEAYDCFQKQFQRHRKLGRPEFDFVDIYGTEEETSRLDEMFEEFRRKEIKRSLELN